MTELERYGREWTIRVSLSVILFSIATIIIYHRSVAKVPDGKITEQLIRMVLTVALLYFAFQGRNWARIVMTVLAGVAALIAVVSLFSVPTDFLGKVPFLVAVFIFGMTAYHFGFSKGYRAFMQYCQEKRRQA